MRIDTPLLLATDNTQALFIWIGVLALFVIAGTVVLMQLRKKLIDHPHVPGGKHAMPFTLDQLRQMHRDALLTDDEFDKAKQQLLQAAGYRPAGAAKDSPAENSTDQRPSA